MPVAAVRQHIARREPPPPIVDDLIRATYRAVVADHRRARRNRARMMGTLPAGDGHVASPIGWSGRDFSGAGLKTAGLPPPGRVEGAAREAAA